MFAPKVAKPRMKAARSPTRSSPSHRPTLAKNQLGDGSVPLAHPLEHVNQAIPHAARVSWDFSKLPLFAPDQPTRLQAASSLTGAASPAAIADNVLGTPGLPLDSSTRAFTEPRFDHDFSRVRVHTNEDAARSAEAVGAKAYTVGTHIVFAKGRYEPATPPGMRLLAHELAHVAQQRMSTPRPAAGITADAHERHADAVAETISPRRHGGGATASGAAVAASPATGARGSS